MNGRSPAVRILFTCFVPKMALFVPTMAVNQPFFGQELRTVPELALFVPAVAQTRPIMALFGSIA